MKTVTSEDNLTAYFLGRTSKGSPQLSDIHRLNHKVKSIKAALKLAQRHNEDLHLKIKTMKQNHQLELLHLDSEVRKYKQLHDLLAQNYQLRGLELKECRKRLKKVESQQAYSAGTQLCLDEAEETSRQYRETIMKQEKEISRLRQQGRLLYEQLYQKSARIKELESILTKGVGKNQQKDRAFLNNLRTALQSKSEEFEKIVAQKSLLASSKGVLERENSELSFKLARISAELDFERRAALEAKERLERHQKQGGKAAEELRILKERYGQLLNFSYELQKDFQRELHQVGKEVGRIRS